MAVRKHPSRKKKAGGQPVPRACQAGHDKLSVRNHYIERNLNRTWDQPEYTLRDLSRDLGVGYQRVKKWSAEDPDGHWPRRMRERLKEVRDAGADAALSEAKETEARVRAQQSRRAAFAQEIAETALTMVFEDIRNEVTTDPKKGLRKVLGGHAAGDVRTLERLLRTGLEQQRAALGMARVIALAEEMGEESPMENLARHRKARDLAHSLMEELGFDPEKE